MNIDYDAVEAILEKKDGERSKKSPSERKGFIDFYLQHLSYIQDNLIALMYFRKCTVAELAKKTEIEQKMIQDFIDGKDLYTMDMDEFIGVSIGLGVPLHVLFSRPEEMRAAVAEQCNVELPPTDSIREKYARS